MLDLPAIHAFVEVGRRGGFRAAATVLGITSSTVSKAVARLEQQVGVQLVRRTSRVVTLTPAGTDFHERCVGILAELDAAQRVVGAAGAAPTGRLVVAVVATAVERSGIIPVIAAYLGATPTFRSS